MDKQLGEPIKFYNGTETLQFDREGAIGPSWTWYKVTEQIAGSPLYTALSGVTGIVKIIDKSLYLVPWGAKMMYLKMLRTMPKRSDADGRTFTDVMPWGEFDQLLQDAKGAHKEKLEDAGDVGHLAHQWIENSIKQAIENNDGIVEEMDIMAPTDERAVNAGTAAHKWMVAHNVRWVSTERPIYSRQYGYAGTADGTALVDSCTDTACCTRTFQDELALIDWKSSNQLSLEYLYQTAAYLQAMHEEDPNLNIRARWILRLGKDDGKFEPWYEQNYDEDFSTYLACLNLTRLHKAVEKRMSEQKKLKTFRKREERAKTKAEEAEHKKKMKFEKRKAKDDAAG